MLDDYGKHRAVAKECLAVLDTHICSIQASIMIVDSSDALSYTLLSSFPFAELEYVRGGASHYEVGELQFSFSPLEIGLDGTAVGLTCKPGRG